MLAQEKGHFKQRCDFRMARSSPGISILHHFVRARLTACRAGALADERRAQPVLAVMRCISLDHRVEIKLRRFALGTTGTAPLSAAAFLAISSATAKPLRASVPATAEKGLNPGRGSPSPHLRRRKFPIRLRRSDLPRSFAPHISTPRPQCARKTDRRSLSQDAVPEPAVVNSVRQ